MKLLLIFGIAVLVCILGLAGTAEYLYYAAIDRSSQKHSILNKKKKKKRNATLTPAAQARREETARRNAENAAFLGAHPPKDAFIHSTDRLRLRLHANVFVQPVPTEKWVVFVHGYHGDLNFSANWIRGFYEKGWNVLAPDLRGHMQSEGDYIGMGWHDRLDVKAWIEELCVHHPDAEIFCLGVSMGGATVMSMSGETLPDAVKALAEDCGYTSAAEALGYQLPRLFHLPAFPFLYAVNSVIRRRAGYDIFQASALTQLPKAKLPMLFIHGMEDIFVPYAMLDRVYDACASEKSRLDVPDARHAASVYTAPKLYWDTVLSFADRYIGRESCS